MSGPYVDEGWRRQFEIFHLALEKEPAKRSSFLDEVCAGDATLRRDVDALLAGHARGSPLDAGVGAAARAMEEEARARQDRGSAEELEPGTVLAERFEISRPTGTGGMGAVFEAQDLRLGAKVALKLLRDEIAGSEEARARFLREINLARKVTHPNVCRVFDLVEDGARIFLTMEILEGETLSQHLRRVGRLDLEEAGRIVEQVASALDAAHAVGVVHRDLKPSNVMLVPGPGETRAVVTDFGLATTEAPFSSLDPYLSRSDHLVGTPAYMAPEQLEGGQITAATDIYALGLMMFEMVTGRQAFGGATALSVASKRLRSEPPSPRRQLPDLDERWQATITRCLEQQPTDRFTSAGEVLAALRGDERSAPRSLRRRSALRLVALAAVALVAVVGLLLLREIPGTVVPRDASAPATGNEVSPVPFEERESVLVTEFENRTGEPAWDGILATALARELSNSRFLTVVPVPRVVDTLRLMGRPAGATIDAGLGREIALRDGDIQAVVSGVAEKLDATYVLSARIIEPESAREVAALSQEAASADGVYAALRRLSSAVRERLGEALPAIRRSEQRLVRVSTPSLNALRLYSEADALMAGITFQEPVVVELLEQALAEDPDFASAHLLLGLTSWQLARIEGSAAQLARAARHLERAMELSASAPLRERYYIRSQYFAFRGDRERAQANREALLRIYPDHFWANLFEGLERSLGPDPRSAIPFQIRKARSRPTSLDANWDAGQILAMLSDRDSDARYFLDRVVRLGAEAGAMGNTHELSWARLWASQERWLAGDVEGCRRELDRWAAKLDEMGVDDAAWMRAGLRWAYRGLGMASRAAAKDLSPASEDAFLSGVQAFVTGDAEGVLQYLGGPRPDRPWGSAAMEDSLRVAMLARSGFIGEAREIARSFEELEWRDHPATVPEKPEILLDLMRGEIALAEGRIRDSVELLDRRLDEHWSRAGSPVWGPIYYESAVGLAAGYEKLGEPDKALAVLERASRLRKQTHPYARENWLRVQLALAGLYEKLGRQAEARAIRDELRRLTSLADADYWLVTELDRAQTAEGGMRAVYRASPRNREEVG